MRRAALVAGGAIVPLAWALALAPSGMTGHMAAHMAVVAVAAPLIAIGIAGGPHDPAHARWVQPLPMSVVELLVVWGWHLPALRTLADGSAAVALLEQAMFLVAGVLLWSACLGGAQGDRRAAGVIALLLTSMHMTLLGALIALAPRPLFAVHLHGGGNALADQQIGGVVMLLVGAGSYLTGGLTMLGGLLRTERGKA
ncbi:cytochrome c oxidase assembly protein [Sphingomonas prati]|uniref:Putative membrane protein n=1 Tax=Sphingomonas prati TaxID=1843237 RepID=A0A7W9BRN5_9SPHN|nr:cytochrome c oxidase assembly protein [Sphingomonas prati]MBB5728726.1 putative membrane protein [Sphingomonas prati]GGE71602.1 hypothetical protein GCM10011404_00050 [Sphingomonas prati]